MMWQDLLIALALVLVIEGVFPFINPQGMKRALLVIAQLSDPQLRFAGITSMLLGLGLLYIIH